MLYDKHIYFVNKLVTKSDIIIIDVHNKKPRKPVGEPTRRSTRVPTQTASIIQASVNSSQGGKRNRRTVSSIEPTSRQLNLLHKVFADDEDRSKEFYVIDVKYYACYQTVCCFSVPYHGNVAAAKLFALDIQKSTDIDDDYIFDCDFVRNNIVGSISDNEV